MKEISVLLSKGLSIQLSKDTLIQILEDHQERLKRCKTEINALEVLKKRSILTEKEFESGIERIMKKAEELFSITDTIMTAMGMNIDEI